MERAGFSLADVENAAAGYAPRPWEEHVWRRVRHGFQRAVRDLMLRDGVMEGQMNARLRVKLERWDFSIFPRARADWAMAASQLV